jgi:D-amino peptidase
MLIFIAADMEGATGVVHHDQLMPEGKTYSAARKLLTQDINAAIEGCLRVIPDAEFIVGDGHGVMRNVLFEELHERASLVIGPASPSNKPLCQLEGINDEIDMAFMIGYHSKAGTPNGLLAHTYVGSTICRLRLNGNEIGEITMNSAIFGSYDIPVGLIVGNDDLEEECSAISSSIEFVSTKKVLGSTAAICYPIARTKQTIADAAERAVRKRLQWQLQPFKPASHYSLECDFYRREHTLRAQRIEGVEVLNELTIKIEAESAASAFRVFWAAVCSAQEDFPAWLK